MLGRDELARVAGADVYGSDGDKIGSAREVYVDDDSGEPEWVTVRTGLFGSKETFVPLRDASWSGDRLTVPYTKDFVKGAPNLDEDGHLSPQEEDQLYAYYERSGTGTTTTTTQTGTGDRTDAGLAAATTSRTSGGVDPRDRDQDGVFDSVEGTAVGHDTSGPTTDDAMTRSEERLRVGTRRTETGRARLRKYVVTENVSQTVPVQHEEVRLEREPITDANVQDATSGPAISEEEHEVVLHEEVPVVEKETVPVERVRLDTETVTEQQTVSGEVRKEQIDVEGGDDTPGTTSR